MKKKKELIYFLLSISVGYLFYYYVFTDYGFSMMGGHYGYYESYSGFTYYLKTSLLFLSYAVIITGIIILLNDKTKSKSQAMIVLDERLLKGGISIEEYKNIKRVINSR